MKNKKKPKKNNFYKVITDINDIKNCYQNGLRAFSKYSSLIKLKEKSDGSVFLDECLKKKFPTDNRWDYIFGYKSKAYFVEFHSAQTKEVSTVIKKLRWLQDWLINHAIELYKIKSEKPYYWIQSNGYHILKNSSQERELSQNGILPIKFLSISV